MPREICARGREGAWAWRAGTFRLGTEFGTLFMSDGMGRLREVSALGWLARLAVLGTRGERSLFLRCGWNWNGDVAYGSETFVALLLCLPVPVPVTRDSSPALGTDRTDEGIKLQKAHDSFS
jgi:hypothetical protein